MSLSDIIKDINAQIGKTIGTIFGPSLVVGIVDDEHGAKLVHLKEFGEEDYHVKVEQWCDLKQ